MKISFIVAILFFALLGSQVKANQRTVSIIEGTIVGWDGNTLPRADVHVSRYGSNAPLYSAQVDSKGFFHVEFIDTGLIRLQLTGTSHYSYECPVLITAGMHLTIKAKLKHIELLDTINNPHVIGAFNNFNLNDGRLMKKEEDGRFSFTFPSPNGFCSYQLIGLDKLDKTHSFNGPGDRFEYDGNGDYRTILTSIADSVTFYYDPSTSIRSKTDEEVSIEPTSIFTYVATNNVLRGHERIFRLYNGILPVGSPKVLSLAKAELSFIESALNHTTSQVARQLLLLAYLKYGFIGTYYGSPIADSNIVKMAIHEIEPSSALWEIDPSEVVMAVALTHASEEAMTFFDRVTSDLPNAETRAAILYNAIDLFRFMGPKETAALCYDKLMVEFPKTHWAMSAKNTFSPNHVLEVGREIPAFSINLLDDSTKQITSESLKGSFYILDFWATWCGPCKVELPHLKQAFDSFNTKGLKIVSISLDRQASDVKRFESEQFQMPWMLGFIPRGLESDMASKFELAGIPEPILVSPEGKILATEADLRGTNLMPTLSKFLDTK